MNTMNTSPDVTIEVYPHKGGIGAVWDTPPCYAGRYDDIPARIAMCDYDHFDVMGVGYTHRPYVTRVKVYLAEGQAFDDNNLCFCGKCLKGIMSRELVDVVGVDFCVDDNPTCDWCGMSAEEGGFDILYKIRG
jgi:hypothetical protein